jgi:pantothenate kinase
VPALDDRRDPPVVRDVGVLLDRLHGLAAGPGRAVVGIAGPPGAGKTTLVEQLLDALGPRVGQVGHLPMDGFHLADVQLDRLGRRGRKGAPDTFDADGYAATLARLHAEPARDVYVPGFERDLEQPIAAARVVEPSARLVLTEGNYLLLDSPGWREARSHLSETWYVDLDPQVRRDRLVRRHERFGKSADAARAWVTDVDDANADLVASTRRRADLVVALVAASSRPNR